MGQGLVKVTVDILSPEPLFRGPQQWEWSLGDSWVAGHWLEETPWGDVRRKTNNLGMTHMRQQGPVMCFGWYLGKTFWACGVGAMWEERSCKDRGGGQSFASLQKKSLLTPWSQTSTLQKCEEVIFWCLKLPDCGALFRQPENINTGTSGSWRESTGPQGRLRGTLRRARGNKESLGVQPGQRGGGTWWVSLGLMSVTPPLPGSQQEMPLQSHTWHFPQCKRGIMMGLPWGLLEDR